MSKTSEPPRLIPLTEWPKHHTWPSVAALRHYVFFAKTNGFDKVIRRVNRRILIDESAFFDWIVEQDKQNRNGRF